MHWSRSFMDSLFAGYAEVEDLKRSTRLASRRHDHSVKTMKTQVEDIEDWLGELALLNQTMLRLLLEKKAFTREELARVMKEIDLLDGVEDGKVTRQAPEKEAEAPKRREGPGKGRRRR